MTAQTRFDLNAAVENWRNELVAQPQLTPDNRRELEKHLTDTMAELRQRGLSEEESFWLARRRVGQPQELAAEFVKANPGEVWRSRMFWMLFGNFLFFIWAYLTRAVELASDVVVKFYTGKVVMPWGDIFIRLLFAILPLVVGVLLMKGKLTRPASAIGWFLSNRKRFALTALAFSGVVSAFVALQETENSKNFHAPKEIPFEAAWIMMWFLNIISVVIILFFMPRQVPKTSETV